MIQIPLFLVCAFSYLPAPLAPAVPGSVEADERPLAEVIHEECGLAEVLDANVFSAAYTNMLAHGLEPGVLAIANMQEPSTAKRLYIVDLRARKLLMHTYVAHGQKTGELMATRFSNENGSHMTSLGMYRVGVEIVSPKHGPALLLHGLEAGRNCQALAREVIMHGADYVSEEFISANGRLGRSWGCPAVSRADMPRMIELLGNGGVLYIHG